MEAREKAYDLTSRRMSYSRRAEFAHACPKLDRQDVQRWIKEFEGTVVKMLYIGDSTHSRSLTSPNHKRGI